MGEVYRAHDTRLNRAVALKVLPRSLVADAHRLRRFGEEARAAGALNHPNVLVVHDVGEEDGFPYLVSELLEGRTLREELGDRPLPVQKAIAYAIQIARGLAAAHDRGIVHRDLKPENVFLTREAQLKILDFGLAKVTAATGAPPLESITQSSVTVPGVAVGTVGYMSPEQIHGVGVDHRSDIFSFGVVLFEMLSGRRPFSRNTPLETLHAILEAETPDLSAPLAVPQPIARIVRRCLAKDPEQRFQLARDLWFALEAADDTSAATGVQPSAAPHWLRVQVPWIAVAIVFATTAVALFNSWRSTDRPPPVVRFEIAPPADGVFQSPGTQGVSAVLAPDGRRMVLVITVAGRRQLFSRSLDAAKLTRLPGTDGASNPFWSPDSRWIAFFADGRLKKIQPDGGALQLLCNVGGVASGAWGAGDSIVVSAGANGNLLVPAAGGDPVPLGPEAHENAFWPAFLPDGRQFIYVNLTLLPEAERIAKGVNRSELRLRTLEPKASSTTLMPVDSRAVYAKPGYLLFVREATLQAQRFDATTRQLSGTPVTIAEGLTYLQPIGFADFSVADDGTLAYQSVSNEPRLVWFSRDGAEREAVDAHAGYMERFRVSPDGKTLAVALRDRRNGTPDLWLIDLSRGSRSRFTSDPGMEWMPVWSPDGTRLAFSADHDAPPFVHVKRVADESSAEPLVKPARLPQLVYDWARTRSGDFILYSNSSAQTGNDLMALSLAQGHPSRPFVNTRFDETDARFSPDGRWVAYVSNDSGGPEVYVRPFEHSAERLQISSGGGASPRWSRGGSELIYLSGDARLMAVAVSGNDKLTRGASTALFKLGANDGGYEVWPDGQRFLVQRGEGPPAVVTVMMNWSTGARP